MKERNILLDILRIAATFMMALHHFQQYMGQTGFWFRGKIWFGILVEFFFLLSGYLSFHHVEELTRDKNSHLLLKKYIRLFPMAAIASVAQFIGLLVHRSFYGNTKVGLAEMADSFIPWNVLCDCLGLYYWIYPGSISISWYASVLMFCYVLLVFIVYISNRFDINPQYIFVITFFWGVFIRTQGGIGFPLMSFSMGRGYMMFFLGVLLGGVLEGDYYRNNKRLCVVASHSFFLLSFLMLLLSDSISDMIDYDMSGNNEMIIALLLFPSLIMISKVWGQSDSPSEMLNNLSRASYETYLWQIPVIIWIQNVVHVINVDIRQDRWYIKYVFAVLMFGIGYIIYSLLERNIINVLMKKLGLANK